MCVYGNEENLEPQKEKAATDTRLFAADEVYWWQKSVE